jgi:HlyD family secretion protein
MRRTIVYLFILALVVSGGFFFFQRRQELAQEPTFEILREAAAENGRIRATVNATGSIEPEALVTLTFGLSGSVQQVNAIRGQRVRAGEVLATLDTGELELTVRQAEDALRIQELTLQQLLNSQPSPSALASAQADIDAAEANRAVTQANLASAEASVLQAQAQRSQLLAAPRPGDIAAAEAQVAAAENQRKIAELNHEQTLRCFQQTQPNGEVIDVCPGYGLPEEQARYAIDDANAALESAKAQLADLRAGPYWADIQAANAVIASAEASVLAAEGNITATLASLARAQAAYDSLLTPPSVDEIAILEARVASSQTNLELAQLRLEQSIIVAPLSGTVANVLVHQGEQISPGAPVMTIVNEDAFHIDVNVDEIDIDRIALSQEVEITLDALPDTSVIGNIAEVAPTSASDGGVVTYLVTINIEADPELVLRPGMSANASIVVEEVDNVLMIPNWAVRLDRETGEAFVNLKRSDIEVEETIVETGLRNELFSEILSGLQVGDVVVVTTEREGFSFFGRIGGGNGP